MEQLGFHCLDFHDAFKSAGKMQVSLKCDKTDNLRDDPYTFLVLSRSFLLRMRNVSERSCRENQNLHFMFSNVFANFVAFIR